jgi:hypothetical protein
MKTYVCTYREDGVAKSAHIEAENGLSALRELWSRYPNGVVEGELIAEGDVRDDGGMIFGPMPDYVTQADIDAAVALTGIPA